MNKLIDMLYDSNEYESESFFGLVLLYEDKTKIRVYFDYIFERIESFDSMTNNPYNRK